MGTRYCHYRAGDGHWYLARFLGENDATHSTIICNTTGFAMQGMVTADLRWWTGSGHPPHWLG